ncbi:respiratory nitrate reductase subunit gamma [Chromobacterium haemolyticum]|uniref:Respiratory nitrate reductase subunit gamma n=1 Tax=Chromobacterium haemolyticum TaxID=394935 RepID=A0ABS3GSW7_9NEIS|nr:respiratory nitrate reductase subunit gamma [Chromobacterium haemolyticum]MBK0417016.1 respiratory nitrate reductase subunit gamma [Chromobacterium haemolyticum]MBO0418143.1 respiratory nitrate reductase subunit gamma [Chromobacterium haemolyticum]MBO0501361.1 respiratory nitrate reductase subunit gamma [Chromobacterium haemolyticum]MDH0340820.1 respiratory nitrate reductase subunit gamma [Chromobacterium haemolyticum]OQS32767.1 respiratory nitrate reductase subunit gamma [Chromobacterium h
MNYLHQFVFGIYPYIALAVFLLGSLIRFDREQYSWKSESSQLLYRGQLRLGNILFHLGIIGLFFGHLVGLLTPVAVWDALGVSHSFKQVFAMTAGGIMGGLCLIGILILLHRRFTCDRLSANTTWRDKLVLLWILATLLLGLSTIAVSAQHLDGHEMVLLMSWAQHIVTLRGDAAFFIVDASPVFKAHLFMGMSLFVIFPFTRLVHVWSGFGAVTYLGRAWQLVRPRT